jgi:Skp family chaperone for outer membrane proteins
MSRLTLGILCAALWLPGLGLTQASQVGTPSPTAASAPLKIAWLNLEQVIVTCEEGKRELANVQKFVDGKNQELEKLRKEAESLRTQLNAQAAKLTDEARADIEEQIENKGTAMQRFQQDTQKQIDNLRTRATNYVGRRMLPVIEKISKEQGYSAVVYINPARDAWVDSSVIITDDVIKAYNQAYPVSATPAKRP